MIIDGWLSESVKSLPMAHPPSPKEKALSDPDLTSVTACAPAYARPSPRATAARPARPGRRARPPASPAADGDVAGRHGGRPPGDSWRVAMKMVISHMKK